MLENYVRTDLALELKEDIRKQPEERKNRKQHKAVIFFPFLDISINQKYQRKKHQTIDHIKYLLIHGKRQSYIELSDNPSTIG